MWCLCPAAITNMAAAAAALPRLTLEECVRDRLHGVRFLGGHEKNFAVIVVESTQHAATPTSPDTQQE